MTTLRITEEHGSVVVTERWQNGTSRCVGFYPSREVATREVRRWMEPGDYQCEVCGSVYEWDGDLCGNERECHECWLGQAPIEGPRRSTL